ncbi:MAG TPA: sigma-70 family RNA polymerase sigma factor [Nannocystaceae bacterium]|nr:sigma-70 family RNA polymerase sigma factor [Nannocystaceae bacterium]
MTADEERLAGERLVQLRRELWLAALSWPVTRGWVIAMVQHTLGGEVPCEPLDQLADRRAREDAFVGWEPGANVDPVLAECAAAFVRLDCDGHAADRIAARLGSRAGAEPGGPMLPLGPDHPQMRAWSERVRECHARLLRARNAFVCANLRLVVKVAQRIGRERMPLPDRVQEGNLGLLKAVERFDPGRGCRFSTYAAWWIRHAITRALVDRARTVRIPAHLHTVYLKSTKAQQRLRSRLGRPPTLAEVAAEISEPAERVRIAEGAMELRSVSLDAPASAADTRPVADVLDNGDPCEWGERMDARRNGRIAEAALAELDRTELDILRHRFGLDGACRLTLREIGERYDRSHERIRQLQNRALEKLREAIEASPVATAAVA